MTPGTNTMNNNDTILKVEHLSMRFGGLMAIDDFSFEARRGNITALIGPNGAGKTTVFNCITGFYKPTMGMITLKQRDGDHYLLERLRDFEITKIAKVFSACPPTRRHRQPRSTRRSTGWTRPI